MKLILIPIFLIIWHFIGVVVLGSIDDEEGRIFNWAKECPYGVGFVLLIWPYVVWKWYLG